MRFLMATMFLTAQIAVLAFFSNDNRQTCGRTDIRTDGPSNRDEKKHLKSAAFLSVTTGAQKAVEGTLLEIESLRQFDASLLFK